MVQLRLTQFKTGIPYNPRSYFNIHSLTNNQKMQLVRCRIWGNTIGDNYKSGLRHFRKDLRKIRAYIYEQTLSNDIMPWVDDWDYFHQKKVDADERRSRILMRGVKIGQKKSGIENAKMGIFDTKKR
jgi:hypothetical protein